MIKAIRRSDRNIRNKTLKDQYYILAGGQSLSTLMLYQTAETERHHMLHIICGKHSVPPQQPPHLSSPRANPSCHDPGCTVWRSFPGLPAGRSSHGTKF